MGLYVSFKFFGLTIEKQGIKMKIEMGKSVWHLHHHHLNYHSTGMNIERTTLSRLFLDDKKRFPHNYITRIQESNIMLVGHFSWKWQFFVPQPFNLCLAIKSNPNRYRNAFRSLILRALVFLRVENDSYRLRWANHSRCANLVRIKASMITALLDW